MSEQRTPRRRTLNRVNRKTVHPHGNRTPPKKNDRTDQECDYASDDCWNPRTANRRAVRDIDGEKVCQHHANKIAEQKT